MFNNKSNSEAVMSLNHTLRNCNKIYENIILCMKKSS